MRSVESDMGPHCLHISHKKDAGLIWVKMKLLKMTMIVLICSQNRRKFAISTLIAAGSQFKVNQ